MFNEPQRKQIGTYTSPPPQGFHTCMQELRDAVQEWALMHKNESFEFRRNLDSMLKKRAGYDPDDNVLISLKLTDVVDLWAMNDASRGLLQAMDRKSRFVARYAMEKVVLNESDKDGGMDRHRLLPREGDWSCPGCGDICDTYEQESGPRAAPPPGSLGLCGGCGQIQRMNAQGNGYEEVTQKEIMRMPKRDRMYLLKRSHEISEKSRKKMLKRITDLAMIDVLERLFPGGPETVGDNVQVVFATRDKDGKITVLSEEEIEPK